MAVSGLCQICETREAVHQCPNCGTLACPVHFDESSGLCADCAAQSQPSETESDVYRF